MESFLTSIQTHQGEVFPGDTSSFYQIFYFEWRLRGCI